MFAGPTLNKEYIRRKSDMCQGFQNIYQSNKTNKNNIVIFVEYQLQRDQLIPTAGVQVYVPTKVTQAPFIELSIYVC